MMRRIGLALLLIWSITWAAYSQGGGYGRQQTTSELLERLWYGGGLSLGFSQGNGASQFQLGASPMVGYKIAEPWSFGPRVAITYNHYRVRVFSEVETANPISWAVGAFMRYKLFPAIFAHTEYEFANEPVFDLTATNELQVLRRERNNIYFGAGYTTSGGKGTVGYETVLLLNINEPDNTVEVPWVLRFAFTYGF